MEKVPKTLRKTLQPLRFTEQVRSKTYPPLLQAQAQNIAKSSYQIYNVATSDEEKGRGMESVGIRELKNRLTHYLRVVQQGRTIIVTSRGRPVARLIPAAPMRKTTLPWELEERMWELAADGFLIWNGGDSHVPEPVAVNRGPRLLSHLVVEDRE